ncbi:(+)-neomenthol dehydrogenase-like isoform X1 [Pyrus communis]|uniref:(+)-neomenthol dehydrogenase-like isoform X1 n=1 Tax=Pyrus communis TaxID=23211 RepID=UPI0035C249F0
MAEATKRYAIVTGANKGVGFGTVKQLASNGIMVVLTARDEKRGLEAVENLKELGVSDQVVFHQLDVTDSASIVSLADFVKTQFGKLDILVNNAGINGSIVNPESFRSAVIGKKPDEINWSEILITPSYELAEECLKTNYYGPKSVTAALLPFLQLSDSPRIINVSSAGAKLMFLEDYKQGLLGTKSWPPTYPAYVVSKAALNAYTRILANKYPNIYINCVCPGFVKTDMTFNAGFLTIDEGAENVAWYAVVTGANKGIGFATVGQLASNGTIVVLTARDEKRGLEAVEKLKQFGVSDRVVFHQLDVTDSASIASLADFVKTQFGKLDILVNNAGVIGSILNGEAFRAIPGKLEDIDWSEIATPNYELGEKCLETNYHGTKRVTEALLPLLQLSDSPRLVIVSSYVGQLMFFSDGWAKGVLSDAESLTEERIDGVVSEFLEDFKQGLVEAKNWPPILSAYSVSKAALNAYTRILAKRWPNFCINCVCPGFVKTDITCNSGILTIDEGAESVVRLALLPNGGPTGQYFIRKEGTPY